VSGTQLGSLEQILITLSCGVVDVGAPTSKRSLVAAGPYQCSHSWVQSPTRFLCQILRLPQPGGPGPHIYIPQEQGDPLIPPGTEFPFCCLLQLAGPPCRYSNCLRTGSYVTGWAYRFLLYNLHMDCIENTTSSRSSVVFIMFITVDKCLACRCLAITASSHSTIQALSGLSCLSVISSRIWR
jgi:hypothetical protein